MPRKKVVETMWGWRNILFFICLPLLLGMVLSSFVPRPLIGTLTINNPIDDYKMQFALEQLRYAETHSEIRAVLLILDCPGGTISGTELIYLELMHLRQTKPVVTMIEGLSASGAYYLTVATDYAIANPSALVGNVGVLGEIPSKPRVFEETYSTGPYKLWGFPQDEWVRQMDMMKTTFLQAVLNGRGNSLKITPERILRGEVYPASEALRLGLIDEIGPLSAAIEKTADLAHIDHYQVVDLWGRLEGNQADKDKSASGFYAVDENGKSTNHPKEPGFYYLYVPDAEGWQP